MPVNHIEGSSKELYDFRKKKNKEPTTQRGAYSLDSRQGEWGRSIEIEIEHRDFGILKRF